ncbi:MAG: hypothetical protein PHQ20_02645, partial [Candidatus Moranbacteria bacterium]|nr:hypothetical protein [Candidatus Moranbacteria bacterium]
MAKPKNRRAKRKGGLGEMNFCPPAVPQSGTGGGKRFRNSALAEYQNRKIFVSLIKNNFCAGAIKEMFRKFFCFACRSEAEAGGNAGRDYSKSVSGFCSKKVLTSSKRHRQMILSDKDIQQAIQQGEIVVDPFDVKDLQPASVDLHLDRYF